MAVNLTENAASHVKAMLEKSDSGIGLRVATRKSGCTGYAYEVDYASSIEEDDHVFESNDVKVIVKDEHLSFLDGMVIDFVKQNMLNEGFDFINPNVQDECGCGESVSFK
ncbi:MAG: iron-sulfur cluster assembly accessory protein [Gammaproteobacteria bacterium]|nr:iron-sulfur cluster assembly accessory protein [Gammaproteobacteria bacterium]